MRALRRGIAIAVLSIAGCDGSKPALEVAGGDAERGRAVLEQFECGACHRIPGVRGARGRVGPPLAEFRHGTYVAGRFENSPEVAVRWILDPPAMKPSTAMPAQALTEVQARDAVAYLYSLE